MTSGILIAVLVSSAALLAVWLLLGVFVIPIETSPEQNIVTVLSVTGPADSLEQTVIGLLWLSRSGALSMDIVISDEGMDEETRLLARGIEKQYGEVSFLSADNTYLTRRENGRRS